MMLSRAKPVASSNAASVNTKEKKKSKPELEDFIKERDYTGAITLLEVRCCLIYVIYYIVVQ
jgi:intraflagellar transport protein 56